MNKPLISIVTVCRNSEKTIARTIESVLAQEFKDYEYIIVDGASSDRTVGIIRQFEPLFEGRMNWISEPDKGIYDAFNKGIRRASGEYVWIVNSDDYIEPAALHVLEKIISDNPDSPVISAGAYRRNAKGDIVGEYYYKQDMLPNLMKEDSLAFVHPSTLIPLETYSRIGLYDERYVIAGDLDLSRRIWQAGEKLIYPHVFVTNMSLGGISDALNLRINIQDRIIYFKKFHPDGSWWRFIRWLRYYIQGWVKKEIMLFLHIKR